MAMAEHQGARLCMRMNRVKVRRKKQREGSVWERPAIVVVREWIHPFACASENALECKKKRTDTKKEQTKMQRQKDRRRKKKAKTRVHDDQDESREKTQEEEEAEKKHVKTSMAVVVEKTRSDQKKMMNMGYMNEHFRL